MCEKGFRDVSDGNFSLFKSLFCKTVKRRRGECERTGQREDACLLVCSFQLGDFFFFFCLYRDESENRKAGSNKQDERKTTRVLLPVSELGRKLQIF